jgi:hypothetical protein
MSQHHAHHRRHPSALKTSGKGQRPGLSRALSSPKVALGKKRATEIETEPEIADSEDDMTFLQYWYAMHPTLDKGMTQTNISSTDHVYLALPATNK